MSKFKDLEKRLHFEHELINRRLNWLLSSQTILFAALAFVLGKDMRALSQQFLFIKVIPILGLFISICILWGVTMGLMAKYLLWQDYNRRKLEQSKVQFGVRTWITLGAFAPDILMPLTFAITWLIIYYKL